MILKMLNGKKETITLEKISNNKSICLITSDSRSFDLRWKTELLAEDDDLDIFIEEYEPLEDDINQLMLDNVDVIVARYDSSNHHPLNLCKDLEYIAKLNTDLVIVTYMEEIFYTLRLLLKTKAIQKDVKIYQLIDDLYLKEIYLDNEFNTVGHHEDFFDTSDKLVSNIFENKLK